MTDSDPLTFAAKCASMTDAELIAEWNKIEDPEHLDAWGQAVIDEMTEREVDF